MSIREFGDIRVLFAPDSVMNAPMANVEDSENTKKDELIVVDELPSEEDDNALPEGITAKQLLEENARLTQQLDNEARLSDAITDLGSIVAKTKQEAPSNAPVQQPGESDEEFTKRFNKELFGSNPKKAFDEAVNRAIQKQVGPVAQQLQAKLNNVNKQLYKDDPIIKKYGPEIDEEIAKLPPNVRNNPDTYEMVKKLVTANHLDEIISDRIEEKLNENKSKPPQGTTRGNFVEGSSSSVNTSRSNNYITTKELDEVNNLILRGVDPEYAKESVLSKRRK